MPNHRGKDGIREQRWKEKPKFDRPSMSTEGTPANAESIADRLTALRINETGGQASSPISPIQFGSVPFSNQAPVKGQTAILKHKSHGTVCRAMAVEVETATPEQTSVAVDIGEDYAEKMKVDKSRTGLNKLFKGLLGANFSVDNFTYTSAQIRATFYPKFENEKSDQEVRTRMIEMVSHGLATLEVSLKHSGSLFMYAGHEGGAYAKNSYGNIYTAVGVFVLGWIFCEAWGIEARKKQAEFNEFLERNHMCISMELVTSVLGDHGQRPRDDYESQVNCSNRTFGLEFNKKWRLPTNHVWLFSTRKSVTSFFAAYDALCEEGTATPICRALDQVADISVPGSKDHVKVQGEILEGLVARIVSPESSKHMEEVLRDIPPPPSDGDGHDLGPSLRDICAANRSNEKQQIKALLQSVGTSFCSNYSDWFGNGNGCVRSRNADRSVISKFLKAHPANFSTIKLQEMIHMMKSKHYPAAFKCYCNFHKLDFMADDNLHFKMVIHVHSDSAFRRYQKEMRYNQGLWPLYRGFFVDINLFKVNKEKAAEFAKDSNMLVRNINGNYNRSTSGAYGLDNEDGNLMIKLKFLTYKLRTFLIRNGLSILFKLGPAAYKEYYLRQMKIWNTSAAKQRELSKMLDEWAIYIRRKCGNKEPSSSMYLSEAEPFLEQYAKRSPLNQSLIGSAGNLIRAEDFLAIIGGRDEEGDLDREQETTPSSPGATVKDLAPKREGLIVFFPGIPGCAKSSLCKAILKVPGGLGDDRPISSLMGDLIKGRYWPKVAEERRKRPYSVTLADKNAPNEEVWRQIEDMCQSTRASAVPIIPDSEGNYSNPYSLDALAVFMFRVLQRVNHPGNLDNASPNAGYVLLKFYHLYEGKNRKEFESNLVHRFGALVKMPLLKADRCPLPNPVKSILEDGLTLYRLHIFKHGRLDSTRGPYAMAWVNWEKQLRESLIGNANYLSSVQVPFDYAVKQALEQLKAVAGGDCTTPITEKRKFGTIVFAAVTLPVTEIRSLLDKIKEQYPQVEGFLKDKDLENSLKKAHVTLAHKRSHGVTAVASYGVFLHQNVPVDLTALLFSDKLAAFEAHLGLVNGEKITSKNQWPHVTLWTGEGVAAKEANTLPQLLSEGKATRIEIDPSTTVSGSLEFY